MSIQSCSTIFVKALSMLLLGTGMFLSATAEADQAQSPASLRVYPAEVQLTSGRDRQALIVQALYEDGITRDVTADVKWVLSDEKLVHLEGNVLASAADGSGEVIVEYAGHSVKVPCIVSNAAVDPAISFRLDVMPVFMKANCNTGSCHGAARGKDGFRLSLFGFDPEGDYFRLTRQISGRRLNLAHLTDSLMMEKATGKVPHTGGQRFDENSEYAATLVRWLDAGAPNDEGEVPRVESVEIFPEGAVLDGEGATQQINVLAKYSNGTDRDVTSLAYFMTNNDNSATIDQSGVVTGQNRGESFIMARFETHTVGTQFITLPQGFSFQWQEVPVNNYVDELMYEKFKKLRIQPSDLCSDEQFLRRASLDIAGLLPTIEQYEKFAADDNPKKRDELVDDLLSRKEFVEMWVMKWAELLQIRTTNNISYKSMLRYYTWLQDKIANNVPFDQMVKELLGANGGLFTNAATNYYQNETNTLKIAENVAQVFMGMRIQCAQCHNHPFDRWKMDDYYSFAAFFSQIGRKGAEDPRETIIFNSGSGEVNHPIGGRTMPPKFLGGEVPDVSGKDRRVVMAEWLASAENPYFATNLANVVWAHFFGKGIINEVDDVRVSNPPVNDALLKTLGLKFTEYDYDFKRLVRDICTSRTYQLSTQTNETNEKDVSNFSHAALRRIRAEVLLDCISQATDTKNKFQGLPLGARAVQIANGNTSTYFLTTFGRAKRGTVCSCEVKIEPNLSQALHLINGDTLQGKIAEGDFIGKRLEAGKNADQIIDELYLTCLCRRSTDQEKQKLNVILDETEDKKQALEDVFWGLLNSREFVFNH